MNCLLFFFFFQKDYIQRISGKMSSIDRAPQNAAANVLPSNSVDTKTISTDTGSEMENKSFLRCVIGTAVVMICYIIHFSYLHSIVDMQ